MPYYVLCIGVGESNIVTTSMYRMLVVMVDNSQHNRPVDNGVGHDERF